LAAWREGKFDLIVSETLLAELSRSLTYPKLLHHVSPEETLGFRGLLEASAIQALDRHFDSSILVRDPDDIYLVALAKHELAFLVSGDKDLLSLAPEVPVLTPAAFLAVLRDAFSGSQQNPGI
jgi:putative PIN family toxin of toxin-antitoxin system